MTGESIGTDRGGGRLRPRRDGYFSGDQRPAGGYCKGQFRYAVRRLKGVATGGDPKEVIDKTLMGKGGADNLVGFCRRETSRRTNLGNDGPTPKGGGGGYGGIRLVEATWKICAAVINSSLKKGVELHE